MSEFKKTAFKILSLAIPILIGQISVVINGVIDTMMLSRISSEDISNLSALAIGASIYISIYVSLNGVIQGMFPIVGQLFGAKKFEDIGYEVKQAVWLALFLSVLGILLLLYPKPLLILANASPHLSDKVESYLRVLTFAFPAHLLFVVYSSFNNALARPKMVMIINVCAPLIKIPLSALFIFGGFGLPKMGSTGCALATAIVSWIALFTGYQLLLRNDFYKQFKLFNTGFAYPDWRSLKELIKVGLPMGFSVFVEVTSFTFAAIFIARLGETVVAAHQIVANFATLLYIIPLSISSATCTLVAQAIGAHKLKYAEYVGISGVKISAAIATFFGLITWFACNLVIRTYEPPLEVFNIAVSLFIFICFYQIFDGVQIAASYVLRAYKKVFVPTLFFAFALWFIGLGAGIFLALNPMQLNLPEIISGPAAYWFCTGVSLVILSFCLTAYMRYVQKQFISQV